MVHYLNGTFPPLFLDNGQLIHPRDLTLGGCVAQQTSNYILGFQAELHGCNSMLQVCGFFFSFFFAFCFVEHLNSLLFCLLLQMTEDALIYSFSLVYSPTPIGNTVIVKTNPAKVLIECHYQRYAQLPPHSPKKHKKKYHLGDVSHPNTFVELQKSHCNLPNCLEKLLPLVISTREHFYI